MHPTQLSVLTKQMPRKKNEFMSFEKWCLISVQLAWLLQWMFQLHLTNIKMCFVSLDSCNAGAAVPDFCKNSCISLLWIQKSITENMTDATCDQLDIVTYVLFASFKQKVFQFKINILQCVHPLSSWFLQCQDRDPESRSKAWGPALGQTGLAGSERVSAG